MPLHFEIILEPILELEILENLLPEDAERRYHRSSYLTRSALVQTCVAQSYLLNYNSQNSQGTMA